MYNIVCIAIVLHGTSTIEPMYGVAYSTSSVPVPSISVLSAKYVIVVLAGYSLSIDDDNKRITKKNERIMAKLCQV